MAYRGRTALWEPEKRTTKIGILSGVIAVTLGIHYGWLIEPIFGHVHWLHAIHGRFCYIPIVVGAAWFGLRGGLYVAGIISVLVLPLIVQQSVESQSLAGETAEIVFYFAIAGLSGALFDRELRARTRAEEIRRQLEHSQKLSLVGQIAAGMAHEIKNPLASIKGAVEILSDESTPAREKGEFREIVFKEIRRVNSSVTDFLQFAHPGETKRERVPLSDLVRSGVKQVEPHARKLGIDLTTSIEEDMIIEGDGEKIHQVLLNLILNAMEASNRGAMVAVSLAKDVKRRRAVTTVDDQGHGVATDKIDRIFEPFFTTKSSGTGLGLAIAASIVESHGGEITIANRPEKGARATVALPLLNERGK